MKSFLKFLFFVLLLALGISLIYVWQAKQLAPPQTRVEKFTPADKPKLDLDSVDILQRLNDEYAKVTEAVVPSVVSITTTKTVERRQPIDPLELFFGRRFGRDGETEQKVTSLGSGVIVSKEGHIVTNNHVVDGTDDITVQLNDGREAKARVIGTDSQIDLAVLRIDLPNLSPLPLGDSDKVHVGQIVFAIGNPFGLEESVSQGIISAKDRRAISDSSVDFFQTDTAINPGNSGGPLVNIRGEVVAINTAIYSESGGNQGIGFAIPSNVVRRAMTSIIKKGRVVRGYLGVSIQPVTQEIAEQFKLDSPRGALVTDVTPGSPADQAGIIHGDVIRKINNTEIRDVNSLMNRVAEAEIGSELPVELIRDGKSMTVMAKVAEQPPDLLARLNRSQRQTPSFGGSQQSATFAGVQVQDLTPRLRSEANVPDYVRGVVVTDVDPSSAAARQLRPGDVIEEINRQSVTNTREFQQVVAQLDMHRPIVLGVARNRQRSFVILKPQ
ncbi:MAG: DegQ family serine endoprotease [Verrucomicrobia bacterium]|nr:DegQ family serine endoprotease [Verrucomicrobiota bacterium]